jgi:hypothetical protein
MAVKTKRVWAIVFPLCLLLILPAVTAAEGWSWPNLNPFAKKESARSSDSGWSLNGRKPSSSYASARKSEPSMWDKVSTGTANTWKKTSSALTPWKNDSPPPKPSGSRGYRSSIKSAPQSKTTWYNPTTWFGGEEKKKPESKGPGSVTDFISQPRMPF